MAISRREMAIDRIVGELKGRDSAYCYGATWDAPCTVRVQVEFSSDEEYRREAERLLDDEVVRLAEQSVLARLAKDS